MGLCLFAITMLNLVKKNETERVEKEDLPFNEQHLSKFLSVAAAGSVTIINESLVFIAKKFSVQESHETLTKMNVSMAFKLAVAKFLNSSVIFLLVNSDGGDWFYAHGLANDVTIFIFTTTFKDAFKYLLNIGGIIKKLKIEWEKRKGKKSLMT